MLQITVPAAELWDSSKEEFINSKERTLLLEHSLVSISKWESKWCKSYLSGPEKTYEEALDYIRCMTITQNVDPEVYYRLSDDNIQKITEYLEAPMTATFFSEEDKNSHRRRIVTSELIYYWMIASNIPFECQKWHINRLLTLIRVCQAENQPMQKKSREELLRSNAARNAERRKRLNSKG